MSNQSPGALCSICQRYPVSHGSDRCNECEAHLERIHGRFDSQGQQPLQVPELREHAAYPTLYPRAFAQDPYPRQWQPGPSPIEYSTDENGITWELRPVALPNYPPRPAPLYTSMPQMSGGLGNYGARPRLVSRDVAVPAPFQYTQPVAQPAQVFSEHRAQQLPNTESVLRPPTTYAQSVTTRNDKPATQPQTNPERIDGGDDAQEAEEAGNLMPGQRLATVEEHRYVTHPPLAARPKPSMERHVLSMVPSGAKSAATTAPAAKSSECTNEDPDHWPENRWPLKKWGNGALRKKRFDGFVCGNCRRNDKDDPSGYMHPQGLCHKFVQVFMPVHDRKRGSTTPKCTLCKTGNVGTAETHTTNFHGKGAWYDHPSNPPLEKVLAEHSHLRQHALERYNVPWPAECPHIPVEPFAAWPKHFTPIVEYCPNGIKNNFRVVNASQCRFLKSDQPVKPQLQAMRENRAYVPLREGQAKGNSKGTPKGNPKGNPKATKDDPEDDPINMVVTSEDGWAQQPHWNGLPNPRMKRNSDMDFTTFMHKDFVKAMLNSLHESDQKRVSDLEERASQYVRWLRKHRAEFGAANVEAERLTINNEAWAIYCLYLRYKTGPGKAKLPKEFVRSREAIKDYFRPLRDVNFLISKAVPEVKFSESDASASESEEIPFDGILRFSDWEPKLDFDPTPKAQPRSENPAPAGDVTEQDRKHPQIFPTSNEAREYHIRRWEDWIIRNTLPELFAIASVVIEDGYSALGVEINADSSFGIDRREVAQLIKGMISPLQKASQVLVDALSAAKMTSLGRVGDIATIFDQLQASIDEAFAQYVSTCQAVIDGVFDNETAKAYFGSSEERKVSWLNAKGALLLKPSKCECSLLRLTWPQEVRDRLKERRAGEP